MIRTWASLALALLLTTSAGALAQQSASSGIAGLVTDESRGAIAGATVTVTNQRTNAVRKITSDTDGRFSCPNLSPAPYRIRVEIQGFQAEELNDVELHLGETAHPTLIMRVGNVTEAVSVHSESPLLQTQTASIAQVVGEKQIETLPLSARSVLSLVSLGAGVTPRNQSRVMQYGRRDEYVTVDGGRDSSTNYTIDGVYVRSLRFNNLSLNPPLDAVQEVSLQRSSFSTEYGQGQSVVSIVTKSGSNTFKGSAFEMTRDEKFDARNYFATSKIPYDRNQFGVTAGAPIKHDRLFVFGAFEGLRSSQGFPALANVPSPTFLNGDFSSLTTPVIDPLTGQPFPGNVIPSSRFSKFAQILAPTIPAPNISGSNNYRTTVTSQDTTNTNTLRLDDVLSSTHTLFGRYMDFSGTQRIPGAFANTDYPQTGRNLAIGETWVPSSAWVNEFRFGYNYALHRLAPVNESGRNWVGDIGIRNVAGGTDPDDFGRPEFGIRGFSTIGEGSLTTGATEHIFSVSDAVSRVAGAHSVRFGVQAQYRRYQQLTEVSSRGSFSFNGIYSGNPIADYLLGYCSSCSGSFGSSRSSFRSPTFAPFFDDVWQISRKFTLQMGLRWEYLAPWHEINDQEGSFDAASGKIAYHKVPANIPAALAPLIVNQDNFFPAGIVQKDLNNWAPRVGATYSLNDRMVVRSGFGVYYDNLNLNELIATRLVPPFYGSFSLAPDVGQPVSVDALFPGLDAIGQLPAPFSIDPNNRSAYTIQWNVSVQRTFGHAYLAEVAYTGSRSDNLSKRYNINQADFGTTPLITRLPYPAFQPAILYSSDAGWARFKGLSFKLEKRYSQGLFFLASYQLSKNIDNGSGEIEANDTAYRTDLDADRSYAKFNQTHRAAFSFGYELPFGAGKRWLSNGGVATYLLGEWRVQGIERVASGFPFTISGPFVCACGSFIPQRVNAVRPDLGALDDPTQQRWFDPTAFALPAAGFQGTTGRNILIGPHKQQTDLSVSKQFQLHASTRLEFRAEIYNLFNNTNLGQPNTNIGDASAGVITSTFADPRTMQFALRVLW
jgi:hypothetical protein